MNLIKGFLSAVFLSAALALSAAADTAKPSAQPLYGQGPGDAAIKQDLLNDFRRFSKAERIALMDVTLLCELDRGALSRKREYDRWLKRCLKTEALWTTKYRTRLQDRMIDAQMRIYLDRRQSLTEAAARYFAQKDIIARKVKRREDARADMKEAVLQRKKVSEFSTEILKFFFALRDLANEAQN